MKENKKKTFSCSKKKIFNNCCFENNIIKRFKKKCLNITILLGILAFIIFKDIIKFDDFKFLSQNKLETNFEQKNIKFYLLDDPYIKIDDPRNCLNNERDLFSELFNHSYRTLNISLADIIIPKWSKGGYKCFRNYSLMNNLIKYNSLYFNPKARFKIIDNEIKYFHELKRNNIIKHNSIIHFREIQNAHLRLNNKLYNDVSFGAIQILHGGFITNNRSKLDISLPLSISQLSKVIDKFNSTKINCSNYNSSLTLYFQGRDHGSWLSEMAFIFNESSYDKLNFRTKRPRKIISDSLENNQKAITKGIIINTKKRHTINYKKKLDYEYYMTHSNFCLIISGNQAWSFRFYEALITGCIPVIVSGGWELPFAPAINWENIVLRIEENFNWSNIDILLDRLWGKNSFEQDHILHDIYQDDICKWHKAVREIWIQYFSNEKSWTSLFINAIESKYNNLIKQRKSLPNRINPEDIDRNTNDLIPEDIDRNINDLTPEDIDRNTNDLIPKDIDRNTNDLTPEDIDRNTNDLTPKDIDRNTNDLTPEDIIFLHIPKNAGTFISKLFLEKGILNGIYAGIDFSGSKHKKYTCHNFHRPPIRFIPNSFCIVRNIYERLISIYLYNKSKYGRKVEDFNKCNCNDFLNYTKNRINKYAEGNININDCHYIPQWEYAKNAKYILRFKNLSIELKKLFKKFNVENFNISNKINQSNNDCKKNITINCFDKELLILVNKIYNEDFINLNYNKIEI